MCICYLTHKGYEYPRNQTIEIIMDCRKHVVSLEKEMLNLIKTGWCFLIGAIISIQQRNEQQFFHKH